MIEQVSVFLENKQGALKSILDVLADAGVDIRAISIADTTDFGILRMIVPDPDKALALLKDKGVTASKTAVTGCKLPDTPGALRDILTVLHMADISVEYIYAFVTRRAEDAYVILRVEDNARTQSVLQKAGHTLMTPKEVYSL
ncbi:MAG: ACT domain-containing protein [Oscillospiraceae bacterium]|nr:ACT domain-containing protein [Oscillospiraceae bacterium]